LNGITTVNGAKSFFARNPHFRVHICKYCGLQIKPVAILEMFWYAATGNQSSALLQTNFYKIKHAPPLPF